MQARSRSFKITNNTVTRKTIVYIDLYIQQFLDVNAELYN